jgi:hypothetical protein
VSGVELDRRRGEPVLDVRAFDTIRLALWDLVRTPRRAVIVKAV